MPLHLITGPPNSGRTERLRELFVQAERKSPVLVVPSVSDIFGWERRLVRETGATTGLRVVHFRDLCTEILRVADRPRQPLAGPLRRRKLMADAVRTEWKAEADRVDSQPGFIDALLELVDDFRESMIDPDTLGARISEAKVVHLRRLEAVYRAYLEGLQASRFTDGPQAATEAITCLPQAWPEGRPLFISGFDDMTGQQIELVRRLVMDTQGVQVTITVTHEPGSKESGEPENPATRFSDWMVGALTNLGDQVEVETLGRTSGADGEVDPLLDQVARRLLRPKSDEESLLAPGPQIKVFDSSGVRNQAEALGAEVARLVTDGTDPGQIALVTHSPATEGRLIAEALERFGVPAGLEAETEAGSTAVGSTLRALLRALDGGTAHDLIVWLRGPLGPEPGVVDDLEFKCRRYEERTAEGAARRLSSKGGGEPPGWGPLKRALESKDREGFPKAIRSLLNSMVDEITRTTTQWPPPPDAVREVRMAGAISEATREIEALDARPRQQLRELRSALEAGSISVWSSPAVGAALITSPYSIRGKRFDHVLIASVQEGSAFDRERPGPFLSRKDRSALGMPPRTDPEDQERYLFFGALTAATKGVVISCMTSDESGSASRPSPLVGMVENLFDPKPAMGGRKASSPNFPLSDAPSPREVGRSIAGGQTDVQARQEEAVGIFEEATSQKIDPVWLKELSALPGDLIRAASVDLRTRTLGPLVNENLLADLARSRYGPTSVEALVRCPYGWYVQRGVAPKTFGPDSEPLRIGTAVHTVLHRLFEGKPGERPESGTVGEWSAAAEEITDELFSESGTSPDGGDVGTRIRRMRVLRMVVDFIEESAEKPLGPFYPDPDFLELEFGPVEMTTATGRGWTLGGRLDRIDVARQEGDESGAGNGRPAVVIDYKSGALGDRNRAKLAESGYVQMPLYLHAIPITEAGADLEPVAGIYISVSSGARRGAFLSNIVGKPGEWGLTGTDEDDSLDDWVAEGVAIAGAAMDRLFEGAIDHDASECRKHFEHPVVFDDSMEEGSGGEGEAR